MRSKEPGDEDWEGQLLEYAFGTMEPEAAAEFARRLEECRTHVALADGYTQVVGALGEIVPAAEPPAGHRARLMARVAATPQQTGAVARPRLARAPLQVAGREEPIAPAAQAPATAIRDQRRLAVPLLRVAFGAAALVVIALLAGWLWSAQNSLHVPEGYVAFPVRGEPQFGQANAIVLFNPQTNDAALLANGLQPLPPEQVYELWLIPRDKSTKPVAAGTFNANQAGSARHPIAAPAKLGSYAGVAVSLERAPGVPARVGPVVMRGLFSSP